MNQIFLIAKCVHNTKTLIEKAINPIAKELGLGEKVFFIEDNEPTETMQEEIIFIAIIALISCEYFIRVISLYPRTSAVLNTMVPAALCRCSILRLKIPPLIPPFAKGGTNCKWVILP